jgi:hypothetical protein
MKLSPDDPQLTAYALEELSPEERAEVLAALHESPECQLELEAIRASANLLKAALEREPALELTPAQERAILNLETIRKPGAPLSGLALWFSSRWRVLAWAGAAMIALGLGVWFLSWRAQSPRQEVALNPSHPPTDPTLIQSAPPLPPAPPSATGPMVPPLAHTTHKLEMPAQPIGLPESALTAQTKAKTITVPPSEQVSAFEPVPQNVAQVPPLAALPIVLPAPTLKGTPEDLPSGPNIEPRSDKPRPPFMAPAGVANVAFKMKATGSDARPFTGSYDQVTDGEKEAFDDQVVEMRPVVQWVQVDLGAPATIYAVALWHDHRWLQVYKCVIVQVADDPDFTSNVRTVFNNDLDNSAGRGIGTDKQYFETEQGKLIDAKGIKARYVRAYSKGSNLSALNCIQELEVYGLPGAAQ